jgi:hypothetical protein
MSIKPAAAQSNPVIAPAMKIAINASASEAEVTYASHVCLSHRFHLLDSKLAIANSSASLKIVFVGQTQPYASLGGNWNPQMITRVC